VLQQPGGIRATQAGDQLSEQGLRDIAGHVPAGAGYRRSQQK